MEASESDHIKTPTFAGLSPPTIACFTAQVRMRYRNALRSAICEARHGGNNWMRTYSFWCGVADGMVLVLYDINTTDAYGKARRLDRVKQLVVEREAHEAVSIRVK